MMRRLDCVRIAKTACVVLCLAAVFSQPAKELSR